ncbi:MAG TPA: glycosyltransferase family 9 protein [Dongiaceae bacterium]|nr:glycosyltransferase family 9 protein [Dongiaceae bacterium]
MNEAHSDFERLLVVRLSSMGDVIHALPAAQALRGAFPAASIGWVIEERWTELLCAPGTARRGPRSAERPLADWVHTVELKKWRKALGSISLVEQIARTWNDMRAAGYELAIDLQGSLRSAVIARWSGAPVVYGSREPRESPSSLFYTRQIQPCGRHVVEQGVSIVEAIAGRRLPVPVVEFPRGCAAEEKVERWLRDVGIGDFVILNPGAGWGAKQWPSERYGGVAKTLGTCGIQSVVNYGPGEERLAAEAEAVSEGAARAFQSSISELIALTRRAKLFIGGDTGPVHLAAALQIPVVAIFGPTDPARNGPYGTRSVVLRNPESATTHARNARPDEAMLAISAQSVVEAARSLLTGRCPEAARG